MQKVSIHTVNDYSNYFKGSDLAHGVHEYEKETDKKGKRGGKSWTKTTPPTLKDYQDHLSGNKGLGIVPINGDNKVTFCVIDIDDYTKKTDTYVNLIYTNNMPLIPFRSKSGGLHLYLFFSIEVTATFAITTMQKFLSLFALSKSTEIFPKQKKLRAGDSGNWINLPYFSLGDGLEGSIKNGLESQLGEIMPIDTAILEIKRKQQTKESIETFFEALPLQDAPPCLQSIYLSGDTHHRNDYLFNLACYFKSKYGDEFEYKIMEANNLLADPLPIKEVSNTVTKNKGKEYTYKCGQEPICSICNKTECVKREFGINGDRISQLNFEEFTQYKTEPPYYGWKVNEKELKFFKEQDIIRQDKFRELCFRELHVLPNRLKDVTWTRIVNNALSNIKIMNIDPEDDMSPGAMFNNYLTEFFTGRALAQSREQVMLDRVYKDPEKGCYIFKAKDLLNYVIHLKGFRHFGQTEIQDRLRLLGGLPGRYYVSKERGNTRVWMLPFKGLERFVEESTIEDFEINFEDTFDDKPY